MILTSIMQAMHGLTGRGAELVLPKQWEPGVSYLVTREAGTKAHRSREKGGLGFQNLATQSAPQVATSNLQAMGFCIYIPWHSILSRREMCSYSEIERVVAAYS